MAINPIFGVVAQTQTAYSALNSTQNTTTPNPGVTPSQSPLLIPVRVKKIILDDSDQELFKEFGEWNGIGTIFWEPVGTSYAGDVEYVKENFALPIFPNIKQYPLLNEIVYIIPLPSTNSATNFRTNNSYYFPPLNVWNNQLHNALPEDNDVTNDTAQKQDYDSAFQGEVRRPEDNSTEINLGSTFVEANSIKVNPLLPYEGDIIYEGRFGNSIRLGSTVNNAKIENNWSSEGENGAPITIIMNGQEETNIDPWIPIPENINGDLSSIYMTSTQKLPIEPASNLVESYAKSAAPDSPSIYNKNQILLTSGRLLFNAKDDAIILGAKKSIHLTSDESVNMDANNYIALTAPKVYLGSSQGIEGVDLQSGVLGENLNSLLGEISQYLTTLNIAFTSATDSLGVPIVSLLSAAAPASLSLSQRLQSIVNGKNLLSNKVKISK
jgi:hypothetical protein